MTVGQAPIDPDERRITHQLAVLIAEQDAAATWTDTLGRLVAQNLPADEFTAARLTALRDWRRQLGRTHSRLNWLFDERRNPKHVARDIRRTQAQTRERFAARAQQTSGAQQ